MNNRWIVFLCATAILLFACCIVSAFYPLGQSQQSQVQPAPPTVNWEDVQKYLPAIGVALLGLFVIWVVKKMAEAGLIITVFSILCGIALFASASYLFVYGDKNNDGNEDTQILRVVQPTGDNAELDARYSEINAVNARTNAWSIGSIIAYSGTLYVGVVVFTLVGTLLFFLSKSTTVVIR